MPRLRNTYNQVNEAAAYVQRELTQIGLWHEESRLLEANVYWCMIPQWQMRDALGVFFHETDIIDKIMGFKDGHIYIPHFLYSYLFNGFSGSLRDTIRHEYGHAFAHYYPELIRHSDAFVDVFGAPYDSYEAVDMPREAFVTEYASTIPMEDFAETFRLYVRRKGELLPRHNNRLLKRKWKFVERVIKQA